MPLREAREHFERAYLSQQLILCGGKVGQLAKRVGMERTHLYRKLRSLGVDFRQVASDKSLVLGEVYSAARNGPSSWNSRMDGPKVSSVSSLISL